MLWITYWIINMGKIDTLNRTVETNTWLLFVCVKKVIYYVCIVCTNFNLRDCYFSHAIGNDMMEYNISRMLPIYSSFSHRIRMRRKYYDIRLIIIELKWMYFLCFLHLAKFNWNLTYWHITLIRFQMHFASHFCVSHAVLIRMNGDLWQLIIQSKFFIHQSIN